MSLKNWKLWAHWAPVVRACDPMGLVAKSLTDRACVPVVPWVPTPCGLTAALLG